MTAHFVIVDFVAHDSKLRFGAPDDAINAQRPAPPISIKTPNSMFLEPGAGQSVGLNGLITPFRC